MLYHGCLVVVCQCGIDSKMFWQSSEEFHQFWTETELKFLSLVSDLFYSGSRCIQKPIPGTPLLGNDPISHPAVTTSSCFWKNAEETGEKRHRSSTQTIPWAQDWNEDPGPVRWKCYKLPHGPELSFNTSLDPKLMKRIRYFADVNVNNLVCSYGMSSNR